MKKLAQIADGTSKRVYATDDPNVALLSFKDIMISIDGLKRSSVRGKGAANNQISNELMKVLQRNNIPTHFIEEISDTETLVRRVKPIPVTVIVRNYAAGTLAERLGLREGTPMKRAIVEYRSCNHDLGCPNVNVDHIVAMGWATESEIKQMTDYALKINKLLTAFLAGYNIRLIDVKTEFGYTADGELLLCDELGPDVCRFWDMQTNEKFDKDLFREDMPDGLGDSISEVLRRIRGD